MIISKPRYQREHFLFRNISKIHTLLSPIFSLRLKVIILRGDKVREEYIYTYQLISRSMKNILPYGPYGTRIVTLILYSMTKAKELF